MDVKTPSRLFRMVEANQSIAMADEPNTRASASGYQEPL
jgi:hypothetical protein